MKHAATKSIFGSVRTQSPLWRAWRHVQSKGSRSQSRDIRIEVEEFAKHAETRIRSISRRLKNGTFAFSPAIGVAKKRRGKKSRPIVIAPVETRIVQRSILNAMADVAALKPFFDVPSSYGMKGVPSAMSAAYETSVTTNGVYYIRSDIESFFAQMPRAIPLARVSDLVPHDEFNDLVGRATDVDLANAAALGRELPLFPDDETGVAQGCALSSLIGDILLYEFDRSMNGRGIKCLRYVDDFLLLGPNPASVRKAFNNAQSMLGKLGLNAYEPGRSDGKADEGWTSDGWEFLGCEIVPGIIRPSARSKRRLLDKVDSTISRCNASLEAPEKIRNNHASMAESLTSLDRLIRGWGNQYSFCNDADGFSELDREIKERVDQLIGSCSVAIEHQSEPEALLSRQRIIGVHVLKDSKTSPLAPEVHKAVRAEKRLQSKAP